MELKAHLLAHGVPKGQKIWGLVDGDRQYIESFYGLKWEIPELMKVEARSLGSKPHCYYTLLWSHNIFDVEGRKDSYFALTLRVNAYYADVQNVYNILRAVGRKLSSGKCLRNGRYLVSDFVTIDTELRKQQDTVCEYLGLFADFLDPSGFPMSQGAPQRFNLHECGREAALAAMRQTGALLVSPCFASRVAQQEIDTWKAKATNEQSMMQAELATIRQQANTELSRQVNEMKRQTEATVSEYKDYKQQYEIASQKLKEQTKVVDKLESEKRHLESDLFDAQRGITRKRHDMSRKERLWRDVVTGVVSFFFLGLVSSAIYFGWQERQSIREDIGALSTEIRQVLPRDSRATRTDTAEIVDINGDGDALNAAQKRIIELEDKLAATEAELATTKSQLSAAATKLQSAQAKLTADKNKAAKAKKTTKPTHTPDGGETTKEDKK